MSCRETSGGSASLSLVRARTGLPESELKSLFHSLKREAAGMPDPTEEDLKAWRDRQMWLLKKVHISERQRRSIEQRMFRSNGEPLPDGSMFYAWSRLEGRALQEQAIAHAKQAVDLSPPGSQAELYEYDDDGKIAKVYYASYGSNLFRERFLAYIEGGMIEGSNRAYWGCRDTSTPEDDIPIRFAARPMFAMESYSWGGGVAFMDAEGEGTGLGRAYLISGEQFDDVVAQENGYRPGDLQAPLTEAVWEGSADIGDVMYGRLVHIGDHNGAPVVTFTGAFSTSDALTGSGELRTRLRRTPTKVNRPSPGYVRMIGAGLKESFGLSEIEQADYIRGCPGGDQWTRKDLVTALRGIKLPEEIEAEKKAADAARKRKAAEEARKQQAASSSGAWSFGSGGYHGVGQQRPLWSDEPAFAGTASSGQGARTRVPASTFTKCDVCGQMGWCQDRVCDKCRSKSRRSSQPAKPKNKGKGKSKGTGGAAQQKVSSPAPKRAEVNIVLTVPNTTVEGWEVVKAGGEYRVASPSGRLYSEQELSNALIRLVDRQDDLYRRIRAKDESAEQDLADNKDSVQNYTEALASLQSITRNVPAPPEAPAAVRKEDGSKVTPNDMPAAKKPRVEPSRLYYPSTVPTGLTVYVQPHLDEPVLRLPQSDIEFTHGEAMEWLHEQTHLPAEHKDERGVNTLVDALNQMERLRTQPGETPRTLTYIDSLYRFEWR